MRSISKEKSVFLALWSDAANIYVYALNRSFTKSLQGEMPYEK